MYMHREKQHISEARTATSVEVHRRRVGKGRTNSRTAIGIPEIPAPSPEDDRHGPREKGTARFDGAKSWTNAPLCSSDEGVAPAKKGGGMQRPQCDASGERPGLCVRGGERGVLGPKTLCTPPPPRDSYAKVPNYCGPYAYCSLGKAVACTYHIHGELVQERGT